MAAELDLYYFPSSYYSQKALLTVFEKNVPFKDNVIYIHLGEQNQEWYLRMNPDGQVPVVKDGDDVISGSEEILDYIDRKSNKGPQLIPDISTPLGQRVAQLRQMLYDVPIEEITFGILLHPNVRAKEPKIPKDMLQRTGVQSYEKAQKASISNFTKRLQAASPSLRDSLTKKMEKCQWRIDHMLDERFIRTKIEGLQETFDRIENELKRTIKESGTEDVWMCGITFTAVDLIMAVFMNRLGVVGLDEVCYSAVKRPLVYAYHKKLFNRPTVKRLLDVGAMERSLKLIKRRVMKNTAKKVVKVSLVIGVVAAAAYGIKMYMNSD